jgi:two-component system response regulator NreC
MGVAPSIKVLVSSDYTLTREGLRSLLQRNSEIEIVGEAETITATPAKVRELAPHVALIELSGSSRTHGLRTIAKIVKHSPRASVVVLTSHSDISYVHSVLACGVSAYLLKTCTTAQLVAAVQKVTRGEKVLDPALGSDLVWHRYDHKNVRSKLSIREVELLTALVRGCTNMQSANSMGLSVKTVETYRLRLYRKLHVRTRAQLVEYAVAHRLLSDEIESKLKMV